MPSAQSRQAPSSVGVIMIRVIPKRTMAEARANGSRMVPSRISTAGTPRHSAGTASQMPKMLQPTTSLAGSKGQSRLRQACESIDPT